MVAKLFVGRCLNINKLANYFSNSLATLLDPFYIRSHNFANDSP